MNTIELFEQWMQLAREIFPESTPSQTLQKLREETTELEAVLLLCKTNEGYVNKLIEGIVLEEAADCLMCLLHIVGSSGSTLSDLVTAFEKKLLENKYRVWVKNENGTYSHA